MGVKRIVAILAVQCFPVTASALEPDQIYAKVASSIVVVIGRSSSDSDHVSLGSGVVIAPGQVITNCHVVKDSDVAYLEREGVRTRGVLRYADPDRDLCQIGAVDTTNLDRPVSRIFSTADLRVGQKVYAIGAPQGLELTLSDGLISSLRELSFGTIIQTNAPVSEGSSGGGLFDSLGRLIGITTFGFGTGQNLNFAIPATWIDELPSRHQAREEKRKRRVLEALRQAEEEERLAAERRAIEEKVELERKRKAALAEQERAAVEKEKERFAEREADLRTRDRKAQLIEEYYERIRGKIRGRVVPPPGLAGNPEVKFDLILFPWGDVLSIVMTESSGSPAFDVAVERAILASQPLPVPDDPDLFHSSFRELKLVIRPYERRSYDDNSPFGSADRRETFEPRMLYGLQISQEVGRYQRYPLEAQRKGLEGTTEILLQIAEDGTVKRISLGRSSGHTILDEEALSMVRRAIPLPRAPENLRGREFTVTVPVVFKLRDSL